MASYILSDASRFVSGMRSVWPGEICHENALHLRWGLGVGFALARLNLISILGRVSLAAGGLLLAAATIGGLLIFVPHRWMTGVSLVFGNHEEHRSLRQKHQLSVRSLLILTAAFAVTAFLARAAVTAPSDPYADDHDILVIHSWLGFFPCLSAAPVLLIIFRPSWRIILVGGFYLVVATLDSVCLGWAAPFMLNDQTIATTITFPNAVETIRQSLLWHGQAVTAIVVYGVLARFSGFRMVLPVQSNDKNPNPSAHPDIEAGCDQD